LLLLLGSNQGPQYTHIQLNTIKCKIIFPFYYPNIYFIYSAMKDRPIRKADMSKIFSHTQKVEILNGKKLEESKKTFEDKLEYNALDLYELKTMFIPKLLDPFLQTVGLASLVGTSDSGKSTFLRQLSLSIALKLDKFLDFDIKAQIQ